MDKLISKFFAFIALHLRICYWTFDGNYWIYSTYGGDKYNIVATGSVSYGLGKTKKEFFKELRIYLYGKQD